MNLTFNCTALLSAVTLFFASISHAETFVVTSNLDTAGNTCAANCTLRQAINAANSTNGITADSISFSIRSNASEIIIAPSTPLPTITGPVSINGYTQTGSAANTDARVSNARLRIHIVGRLAGATTGAFNICASNVSIKGFAITQFNDVGIRFGNNSAGQLCGSFTGGSVAGNFIGLATDGTTAAGNGTGITIQDSVASIGGVAVADRNVISGNTLDGILLLRAGYKGSHIIGNLIGTDKTGALDRGNFNAGIALASTAPDTDVIIGAAGSPNRIAFNREGISVRHVDSIGTELFANDIGPNDTLGIDLFSPLSGLSINDNLDGDTGANGVQNFLDDGFTVVRNATGLRIQGTLRRSSTPVATRVFKIAAYASAACDATGHGEGEQFLGEQNDSTSGANAATGAVAIDVQIPLTAQPPIGAFITTTVTATDRSTSEFSRCFALEPALVVNNTSDNADGICDANCSLRDAMIVASSTAGTADLIRFAINPSVTTGEIVIAPNTPLPKIISPMAIDGYSQSGTEVNTDSSISNAKLRIRLDGANLGAAGPLLEICSPNVRISGLAITGAIIGQSQAIRVCPENTGNVTIAGNFIGLRTDGSTAAPNNQAMLIESNTTIGGTEVKDRNVIADGIELKGTNHSGSLILRNLIGTDKTGTLDRCVPGRVGIKVNAAGVKIGNLTGTSALAALPNTIRFCQVGIQTGTAPTQSNWMFNQISDNVALGLNLQQFANTTAVTPNDVDDIDTGPNDLQNFPVLTSVERTSSGLAVKGSVDVKAGSIAQLVLVSIYASPNCHASGHGEGKFLLGAELVSLRSPDQERFNFVLNTDVDLIANAQITTTATSSDGSSEFSACLMAVDAPPGIVVDSKSDANANAPDGGCDVFGDGNVCTLREAILLANSNVDASLIRFDIEGFGPHRIELRQALPVISAPLSIDGYTQLGASENSDEMNFNAALQIEVTNSTTAYTGAEAGVRVCANDVAIRGLSIKLNFAPSIPAISNRDCTLPVQGLRITGNAFGFLSGVLSATQAKAVALLNVPGQIGGPDLKDRNLIANSQIGVEIRGTNSFSTLVQNNLFFRNSFGIALFDASGINVGGARQLVNRFDSNLVGISVGGAAGNANSNTLAQNEFIDTDQAIDLSGAGFSDGITANDVNDVDTGPNDLQNFPVLSDGTATASTMTINGFLDVPAELDNQPYELTFYESPTCAANGHGSGAIRLATVPVNFSSNAENFSVTLNIAPNNSAASVITAAATDRFGSTSEMSGCLTAPQEDLLFKDGFED